nr:non-ribosomal peptide synthetase [Rhodococcus corynebacterioides]
MRVADHTFTIPAELQAALDDLARRNNASLFMVVHAVLAVLLARSSTTDDIAVGTAIAGRPDEKLDDVVGMFVNTLVLRTQIDPAESFRDLLARVRSTDLAAFTHTDIPFERLVEVIAPERSTAHSPLFQVALALQNNQQARLELPGLTVEGLEGGTGTSKFDLQLSLAENVGEDRSPAGIDAVITYATDLFDADTVARLGDRLVWLFEAVVADPTVAVGDIDLLDADERRQLLPVRGPENAEPRTLAALLADSVAANPDGVAVMLGDERVTYRELDTRAARLARVLVDRGVTAETVVASALPRSVHSVVAFWAVAKAGGAVVPVDPGYPSDRIEYMVSDSGATVGLTLASSVGTLPDSARWIALDDPDTVAEIEAADPLTAPARPTRLTDAAYMIYTSGSTGRPKGVVVTHTGLANVVVEQRERMGLTPESRVLHFASPSFDASVFEILMAVAAASTMVIAPTSIIGGEDLVHLLRGAHVTHAFVTPAALTTVDPSGLDELAVLAVAGEACPPEVMRRWAPGRRMFNLYGPSEATIWSTSSVPMSPERPVTIGGPTRGVELAVLDERLQPVPVGVPGELYVAGPSVARGYHDRESLTSERFVAAPFGEPGARMYRTGDVVRWVDSGADSSAADLEYVGRSDFQVKVRGFRIELGEIDSVLGRHDDVDFAVTVGHKRSQTGQTVLVSYVLPVRGRTVDVSALSEHVGASLPGYMVPSSIVVLDRVPLTPAGKLDRRALPEPVFTSAADTYRAPATPMEETLAALFAEVLGVERVGVDDSFFGLGGDSIVSIQLVTRAKAAGVLFRARDVFERRTVAALAEVATLAADAVAGETLAEIEGGGVGTMPLTPIMRWLVDTRREYDRFSQAVFLTLPEGVTADPLHRTVAAVLDHHDQLRTRLGVDTLEVLPAGAIDPADVVTRVVADAEPGSDEFVALAEAELDRAAARLSPADGRMVQIVWFDPAAGGTGRLLVLIHHLVVDGVSWRVLVPDFATAWAQVTSDQEPSLTAVGTSMRTWAHALVDEAASDSRVAELAHWRSVLADAGPRLGSRPVDPAVDTVSTTDRFEIELPVPVTEALLGPLPEAYGGGVNDALLTALALAVGAWRRERGQDAGALTLDLEGHGREEDAVGRAADLGRTVGWFTTLYPVRLDVTDADLDDALRGGPAAGTAVKAVKEQLLAVPERGIGYGLLRHLNAATADELAALPSPEIGFNYLGRVSGPAGADTEQYAAFGWQPASDGGQLGGAQDPGMVVPAVLSINAATSDTASGPVLTASFAHATGVLSDADARRLADLFVDAATALADHARRPDAGGLTPSDVPLVSVTQPVLDRLEDRYPTLSDVWSLAPLQEGMLFHSVLAGEIGADGAGTDVYTAQVALRLTGSVDIERMRAAAAALITRHPHLRAGFVTDPDGAMVQVVVDLADPVRDIDFRTVDLTDADPATRDETVATLLHEHRVARFDLAAPPLMRFLMIVTGPSSYVFSVSNHHILLDGWSMPLMLKDLIVLYAARGDGSVLPRVRPYKDFLSWLSERDFAAATTAWTHALDGLDEPTLLAPNPPAEGVDVVPAELDVALPDGVSDALSAVARERGVTMNTIVQAAWGILLARTVASEDVVFGATVSGRPPEISGIESMLGLFITTIPVRVRLDEDESVHALLERIQSEQADLIEHHFLGLPRIQQAVGTAGLFDTLTVFESYPIESAGIDETTDIDGMQFAGADVEDASHYPLTVLAHTDTALHVTLKYVPAILGEAHVTAIAARLARILEAVASRGSASVGEIDVLSTDERRAVLETWNDTRRDVPTTTVADLLADRVRQSPDSVAVEFAGESLTYAEFGARVARVARGLVDRGVGPDDRVGISLPRSVDLMVALAAVATAGAAYVPIDPDIPEARTRAVLDASSPRCVIAAAGTAGIAGVDYVDVATLADGRSEAPVTDADRRGAVRPDSLAYVLFTSGSTGVPKGVEVTQGALVNQLLWLIDEFALDESDVVLQKMPFTFDASVWELFAPSVVGARTVVAEPDGHRDPAYMARIVADRGVTVVQFVPSVLSLFVDAAAELGPDTLRSLRTVFSGGEALTVALTERVRRVTDARVVNLYGPTEVTVDATSFDAVGVDGSVASVAGPAMPIGHPAWNVAARVLDHRLRPVAPGGAGELYLAGDQLARGYASRADLTSERFVADPFDGAGERLYRTGDLVRWTEDGELEFVGRVDFQVKLRGLRVELEEIESVLAGHPDVAQAAVVVHEIGAASVLAGYVVPRAGATVEAQSVTDAAARVLPGYMVPDVVTVLDSFPSTASGKTDRRALPVPELSSGTYRAPSTPTEITVAGVVAEVLGIDRVGADDSFFELGGDSIVSMQLVARARAAGVAFTAREVFELRTVSAIAAAVDARGPGSSATVADDGVGIAPLSPVAEKMVERGGDWSGFVMPLMLTLPEGVTADALTEVLSSVVERHDVLRARVDVAGHALVVPPAGEYDLASRIRRIPLATGSEPGTDGYADVLRREFDAAMARLDPERGDMLELLWFAPEDDSTAGRLLILPHHLVIDSVSWRILVTDLVTAGVAVSAGQQPVLAPVDTSWRTWSTALVRRAAERRGELDYWRSVLAADDPTLGRRRLDPTVDTADRLTRTTVVVPDEVSEALLAPRGAESATTAEVLVAALSVAVAAWRAERGETAAAPLLTLEGHGREEAVVPGSDLARTVGWFTTMYPARVDLSGLDPAAVVDGRAAGGDDVVARTRTSFADVPDHGIGYGMLRYLDDESGATLREFAEPQIVFNYIGRVAETGVPEELRGSAWLPDFDTPDLTDVARNCMPAQAELDIQSMAETDEAGSRIKAFLSFPPDVLKEDEVNALTQKWLAALAVLAGRRT